MSIGDLAGQKSLGVCDEPLWLAHTILADRFPRSVVVCDVTFTSQSPSLTAQLLPSCCVRRHAPLLLFEAKGSLPSRKDCLQNFARYTMWSSAFARVSHVLLHARHELSTVARLERVMVPMAAMLSSSRIDHALESLRIRHLPIAHVPCTFRFLRPSSCRSAFERSFSFSTRFINGSGWWYGSGIALRTHLKTSTEVFPWLRLLLCVAPATVCCYPCTASRAGSDISGKPLEFFQCHRIRRTVTTRQSTFSNQIPMRIRTL